MDGMVGLGDHATNGRHVRGTRLGITMAFILVLSICASCIMGASADTPEVVSVTVPSLVSIEGLPSARTTLAPGSTSPNPTSPNTTSPNPTSPNPTIPNPTSPNPTIPNPTIHNPTTSNPTTLNQTVLNPTPSNPAPPNPTQPNPVITNPTTLNPPAHTPNATIPNPAEPNLTSPNPSTPTIPELPTSEISSGKTSKSASLITSVAKTTAGNQTVTDLSKTSALPKDIASSPAGYVVETGIPASAARTEHISAARTENQSRNETTSGPEGAMTTAPPTSIVIVYETELVTELHAVDVPTGNETVRYVTPNTTTTPMAGDPGLEPDREKDDLKKLLLIIGGSIGVALVAILISFFIVYRIAKRRHKKKSSRYYNFKKKKSNYEKVLHLQEYHGDLGNEAGTGTGAGWVFDEKETNKAITLEMAPKDKPDGRSAKTKKSRNKNKNNRNKSVGRGNYQVLAEFFPAARRTTPPDALLTDEGAVYSNSIDNGESAILDTSFGPLMVDEKANWSETDDMSSKDSSLRDSMRLSWPSWNTSPYVTITQEDTGVEL